MFTDLLLALTIVTSSPVAPDQILANADQTIECPTPSAMTGPVRTRYRKRNDNSRVASTLVNQQIIYARADDSVRPE